eukprot:9493677-Pyramimonas_sp.AAC.1
MKEFESPRRRLCHGAVASSRITASRNVAELRSAPSCPGELLIAGLAMLMTAAALVLLRRSQKQSGWRRFLLARAWVHHGCPSDSSCMDQQLPC